MPDKTPQENFEPPASAHSQKMSDESLAVDSVIGKSGMGTAYRVEQIFLHKEFAVKL